MSLLFWPFIIASILFAFASIIRSKPIFLIIAFLLIIPFSLYLGATPLFKWWGFILPLFYLAAALAVRKNQTVLAILLTMPVLGIIGWLGYMVITQP